MSTPAHLWLEDENGSPIVGSCLMPLRLGSIELKSFSHGVTIPVDLSYASRLIVSVRGSFHHSENNFFVPKKITIGVVLYHEYDMNLFDDTFYVPIYD